MTEFVSGYLEYLKTQQELSKPCLLSHLQLLMDKATTYSWPSVRNFHQSVHNSVQNRRMSWSDYDKIRERAQTFFTHLDLRVPGNMASNTAMFRSARTKQKRRSAIYKDHHRCCVCESADHPMLHCKKRKISNSNAHYRRKGTKQLPD